MRADFPLVPIGQVCDVIAGQSPKGSAYNKTGDGLPFYQGKKDFSDKWIGYPTTWTTEITKRAQAGDILMSVRAPVGPINFAFQECCIGRGLAAIRPNQKLDRDYLFYALLFKQPEISGNEGAVFSSINKNQIASINIPIPGLQTQKRIVTILDEAFAGIDAAIANTEKNLASARALFESYQESVFRAFLATCNAVALSKHTRFIDYRGRTPRKTTYGLRLITAKNVRMGFLQRTPEEFVDPENYDTWMRRGIPESGDVLFTTEAPLGFVCQLDTSDKVVLAQRIITIQPDRINLDPVYLKYALMSPPIQKRIHEQATGATATGIKSSLLKQITIPFPEIAEQRVAAKKLEQLERWCYQLGSIYEKKKLRLVELKQSLLDKAFKGELIAETTETEAREATA